MEVHLNIWWSQQPCGERKVPEAAEPRQPAFYIILEVESVGGVTSTFKDPLKMSVQCVPSIRPP